MQLQRIVVVIGALALGSAARADSAVPCNNVDDFCVSPGRVEAPASPSAASAQVHASLVPCNNVDEFCAGPSQPAPSGGATPAPGAASVARGSPVPCNNVDEFCAGPATRPADRQRVVAGAAPGASPGTSSYTAQR